MKNGANGKSTLFSLKDGSLRALGSSKSIPIIETHCMVPSRTTSTAVDFSRRKHPHPQFQLGSIAGKMGSRYPKSVVPAKFSHPSGRCRRQAPLLSTVRIASFSPVELSTIFTDTLSSSPSENLLSNEIISDLYETMIATNTSVLSTSTEIGDLFDFLFDPEEKHLKGNPHGFLMEPVYSAFEENPELVGFLIGVTAFGNLLDKLLPASAKGIVCVIKDTCGNHITYELNGLVSTFLGEGDLHDPSFDKYERSTPMELNERDFEGRCVHELFIYPTAKFREHYVTKYPAVYTSVVALAFLVTSILLFVYDRCVFIPLIY
jgi:hypothetical protein